MLAAKSSPQRLKTRKASIIVRLRYIVDQPGMLPRRPANDNRIKFESRRKIRSP
jgi:hypothetical protein